MSVVLMTVPGLNVCHLLKTWVPLNYDCISEEWTICRSIFLVWVCPWEENLADSCRLVEQREELNRVIFSRLFSSGCEWKRRDIKTKRATTNVQTMTRPIVVHSSCSAMLLLTSYYLLEITNERIIRKREQGICARRENYLLLSTLFFLQ